MPCLTFPLCAKGASQGVGWIRKRCSPIPLGFPVQQGTALRQSIPLHVGETLVLPSPTDTTPPRPSSGGRIRGCPIEKAALGTTGMQGLAPAGRGWPHPALPQPSPLQTWDRLIHLFMYFFKPCSEGKQSRGLQRPVRFDCKSILGMSFHCAMIPQPAGWEAGGAGGRQGTGAGGGPAWDRDIASARGRDWGSKGRSGL